MCSSDLKSSVFVPLLQSEYFDIISENDDNSEEEATKLRFFEDFKSNLSQSDKILVTLYLEDLEYDEIAQITGLSEVNARARIHRIKKQIKKQWEEKNGTR